MRLPAAGERFDGGADARVLALRIKGKAYALFAPTGARWESVSATEWIARLPAGKRYVSAAVLPDDKAETLALLLRHAYAFVQGTRVQWRYDVPASQVETTFTATTRVMEGADNGPLFGLYPHHWFKNASVDGKLGPGLRHRARQGPPAGRAAVQDHAPLRRLRALLARRGRLAAQGRAGRADEDRPAQRAPHDAARGLERVLAGQGPAAHHEAARRGRAAGRQGRRATSCWRCSRSAWRSGSAAATRSATSSSTSSLGALASYPDEFFAIAEINDHHFWYGYWIRAAAEIALRDPAWVAKERWGAMVDLMVADIATAERGRADFPFLRNFDPYEGHSWANGLGGVGEYGVLGNNQESSSEAINAWAGLILWGEVTGNRELRDLGAYLYATESQAIDHYWFDAHGLVLAPEYKNVDVAQLFGGKYIHNTWWTDDPRQITGINLLPITTASTYIAAHPQYVRKNLAALKDEQAIWAARGKKVDPPDIWQDVFAKYQSLADPAPALAQWNRWGAVELGETRSHTLHWLLSLNEMGTPDLGVRADTPLYAVFKRADGKKTYLAFNAGKAPISVRFSDGQALTVAPGALARSP